jgi:hypothetical protein
VSWISFLGVGMSESRASLCSGGDCIKMNGRVGVVEELEVTKFSMMSAWCRIVSLYISRTP